MSKNCYGCKKYDTCNKYDNAGEEILGIYHPCYIKPDEFDYNYDPDDYKNKEFEPTSEEIALDHQITFLECFGCTDDCEMHLHDLRQQLHESIKKH